jgi:hypothetical protein
VTTTQTVPAISTTVTSFSTTISVNGGGTASGQTKKLLQCMVKAQATSTRP